jgi:RHS repeat-associated protein
MISGISATPRASINAGSASSSLWYGAYRNRYKQVSVAGGVTETTISIAGLLEKVTKSGVTEYRHRIGGQGGTVAIYTRRSSGSPAISNYYVLRDHLGSPETITDGGGGVLAKLSFAAYGERRDATDWDGPIGAGALATLGGLTREGYTGHGQLDAVGLVHMGGRVYDPLIGRFLSRDPLLALGHGQGPNSYAYTWNNPLRYVDPTGYATEAVEDGLTEEQCIDGSCTTIVNGIETITVNSSAPRDSSSTATRPLPPGSVTRRLGGGGAGGGGGGGAATSDGKQPSQQPKPPCTGLSGAVQDATGGESNQTWYADVADNFVGATDTGASALLSTGLSIAGASTTANSWGGITVMQLGHQAWDSRYGAIRTPGLIGARSVPSAFMTAGASWVVNAVLIKGAYNSGVLVGSLIRTGMNRAAGGACARQ